MSNDQLLQNVEAEGHGHSRMLHVEDEVEDYFSKFEVAAKQSHSSEDQHAAEPQQGLMPDQTQLIAADIKVL